MAPTVNFYLLKEIHVHLTMSFLPSYSAWLKNKNKEGS
jgi:hypothetical protein